MKKAKRLLALFTLLALVLSLVSCAVGGGGLLNKADGDDGGYMEGAPSIGGGDYSGGKPSLDADAAPGDAGVSDDATGAPESSDPAEGETGDEADKPVEDTTTVTRPAGLITAGAWNDNANYDYWKSLFEQSAEKNGKFYTYTGEKSWGFDSYSRLKVTVTHSDGDSGAVAGAAVIAKNADGKVIYKAVTDANGVAFLFTGGESGSVTVSSGESTVTESFTSAADGELFIKLDAPAEKKNIIDIMFVVDVTGSMGDELEFLKNELTDVINRVAANEADAIINLALLFYRDHTDKVPFAYFDFTDVTNAENLAAQQANLNTQFAEGGGDWPEAVDEALELAVGKQWSTAATTKLIFHVLDAPPHSKDKNKETFKSAVEIAAEKGIRYCPIICSGADTLTEYVARQAAIYTAGTFIFVTDDSGIGGSHHDPGLPNVTVEALNSLLVRVINGYHSGEFAPPVYWKTEQLNNQNKQ